MSLKKSSLQVISGITTIGLALGVAAPANALLSDNVHNAAGGGVNIHADNTCVEKIGDTAHIKFMAQHQPLLRSSDHGQTAAHGTLALPSAMKNVSIKIKAVGGSVYTRDKDGYYKDTHREATIFDAPLEVPILEASDEYEEKYPGGPPNLGGLQELKEDKEKYDEESVPPVKETPDPDNPDLVNESDLWTEQEVRDFVEKYDVHMKKTPQGFVDEKATVPFMSTDGGDVPWYGTKYAKDYDLYEFGNVMTPVTFEIEGDVPVEQEDTFVTAAISNLGWKSSSESYAGSYAAGSQSLQVYQWGRPNQLPPAIPKTESMIQIYKDKLTDAGLDISPTIAPTREMPGDAKYSYIGSDIRPSARGDVGAHYTQTFTLHANPAVTRTGQVDTSAEDGADITAAHVTLCDKPEEAPTTTKQLIPDTETPDTETETEPTTTKQLIPDTETPDTETETPDKETETETEPTPTTSEKPSGSSLDEETMKKVGIGLGLGLGGAKLIEKVKQHRDSGGSSNTEHTTEPKPAPSTTQQPAPSTTESKPAPTTTEQAAPSTTAQQPASSTTAQQAAPATTSQAAAPSKTGTLAQTGANVTTLAVAGSMIILAGAAFLLAGRRKEGKN